jgi:hypothetical protein
VAEGSGLLNRRTGSTRTVSSNLIPSASFRKFSRSAVTTCALFCSTACSRTDKWSRLINDKFCHRAQSTESPRRAGGREPGMPWKSGSRFFRSRLTRPALAAKLAFGHRLKL